MAKQHDLPLKESRSARHNVPVRHPGRWRLLAEALIGPATRLHRYRDLSRRITEDAVDTLDCRSFCR